MSTTRATSRVTRTTRYTPQEARRLAGMRLLEHGQIVMEVARSTVSGWKARLEADGPGAIKDKPRSGRPPKLSQPQREELVGCLEEGPLANGYRSDLWTLPRVKRLIQERFGVTFHVNSLGELLRSLGFTPQKPACRSRQRDPKRSGTSGTSTGRRSKKAAHQDAMILLVDECGFCERPLVRRTWVRRDRTPVLEQEGSWKKLSALAALSLQPSGRVNEQFQLFRHNVRVEDFLWFLHEARSRYRKPLIVLWDGLWRHFDRGRAAGTRLGPVRAAVGLCPGHQSGRVTVEPVERGRVGELRAARPRRVGAGGRTSIGQGQIEADPAEKLLPLRRARPDTRRRLFRV